MLFANLFGLYQLFSFIVYKLQTDCFKTHNIQSGIQTNLVVFLNGHVWCVILSRHSDVTMRAPGTMKSKHPTGGDRAHNVPAPTTNKSPQWTKWRPPPPSHRNKSRSRCQSIFRPAACVVIVWPEHITGGSWHVTAASRGRDTAWHWSSHSSPRHHGDQHQVHQVHTLPL